MRDLCRQVRVVNKGRKSLTKADLPYTYIHSIAAGGGGGGRDTTHSISVVYIAKTELFQHKTTIHPDIVSLPVTLCGIAEPGLLAVIAADHPVHTLYTLV